MSVTGQNEVAKLVKLTINNLPVEVPAGTNIIKAAKALNIDIPHLCYHPDQKVKARCRVCSVEVAGKKKLVPACKTEVWDGMEVHTDTKTVREAQKVILELILANHDSDCLNCPRNNNCELQK